ncbi:MAG: YceI family protein [Parvibaculum sp.]
MKYVVALLACLLVAACDQSNKTKESDASAKAAAAEMTQLPAGHYVLDKSHASLIFRVSHLGFSTYTAGFTNYDATLEFDPKDLGKTQFDGTVDVRSLTLSNPPVGFLNDLLGKAWFDADKYPTITFHQTGIEATGPNTADITGDFTMHGVTKPLVLAVTFNGGWVGNQFDPQARAGFSAHGTLKRSDFGMVYGIPEPGANMGVGDDVAITLEAEFIGPPLKSAPSVQ